MPDAIRTADPNKLELKATLPCTHETANACNSGFRQQQARLIPVHMNLANVTQHARAAADGKEVCGQRQEVRQPWLFTAGTAVPALDCGRWL